MMNLKSFDLDFVEINPPFEGEKIASKIANVINDWKINDKVCAITTDGGANCVLAAKLFTGQPTKKINNKSIIQNDQLIMFHNRCAAHSIQLVIKYGLEHTDDNLVDGDDFYKNLINKIRYLYGIDDFLLIYNSLKRDIMSSLKYSSTLKESLKEACEFLKIKYLNPKLDVRTRWGSALEMLERYIYLEEPIRYLAVKENKLTKISLNIHENQKLTELNLFLKELEASTEYVGKIKESVIGEQYIIISGLKAFLDKNSINQKVSLELRNLAK